MMKKTTLGMCPVLAMLTLGLMLPAGARADGWQDKLARGEVLVYTRPVAGSSEPEVVMKAVIDAAPQRVFNLLADCEAYPRTMPRISAAKLLRKGRDHDVCRVTVDMPFPYADATSTCESRYLRSKGKLVRRWKLLAGDYRRNEGSWTLSPFRGDPRRTLAVYRTITVPKAWVPAWIRRAASRRMLPKTIARFRQVLRQRPQAWLARVQR